MIVLGVDPSVTAAGIAVIAAEPGEARLVLGECLTQSKGTALERAIALGQYVQSLAAQWRPAVIVVETPFERARGGPKATRSAMTLPAYGMAVGAVGMALAGHRVRFVAADAWSRGLPGTARDPHKTNRVRLAAAIVGVDEALFGSKTTAGNVADAVLMAWWAAGREEVPHGE